MIVLDASLMLEWLVVEDDRSPDGRVFETMLQQSIRVPSHWPLEIANALRTQIRAGKVSADIFATMMDRLDRLDIEVEPPMDLDEIGPTTTSHLPTFSRPTTPSTSSSHCATAQPSRPWTGPCERPRGH